MVVSAKFLFQWQGSVTDNFLLKISSTPTRTPSCPPSFSPCQISKMKKRQLHWYFFILLLDIAREIGTFWKTNKAHIWLPNIKQGFFGITRPTEAEMRKYR